MNNTIKQEMIQHIRAHNQKLSKAYLEELEDEQLLCEVHPNYREYFTRIITNSNKT